MDVSAKQLVSLFKKAINFPQPNTLDGSVESIRSYYKMIQQFATMADIYQDLIPEKYDNLSILKLADFILELKLDDFQKIANNLPFLLSGFILQDKTTSYPEADVDPSVSKQALSKMYVKQINYPLHVSLILAMYNEHNRIRPKSNDNPNGEDFVRRKMKQMEWLLKGSPINFNMIIVDDGCPKQSGEKAQEIIEKEGYKNVKVLYLDDGIKRQSEVIKGLKSTSGSRKGGSIQYGMWHALENYSEGDKPHIVVFTDADMAAPVNEIGLLLGKQDDKTMLTIASRYDEGSIYRGPSGKNGEVQGLTEFHRQMIGLRGFVFSRLFPHIGKIIDTQCGLKAFNAKLLRQILLKTKVRTFSFDIELLVLAASKDTAIAFAPIYWHDSFAESSFWGSAAENTNDDS